MHAHWTMIAGGSFMNYWWMRFTGNQVDDHSSECILQLCSSCSDLVVERGLNWCCFHTNLTDFHIEIVQTSLRLHIKFTQVYVKATLLSFEGQVTKHTAVKSASSVDSLVCLQCALFSLTTCGVFIHARTLAKSFSFQFLAYGPRHNRLFREGPQANVTSVSLDHHSFEKSKFISEHWRIVSVVGQRSFVHELWSFALSVVKLLCFCRLPASSNTYTALNGFQIIYCKYCT